MPGSLSTVRSDRARTPRPARHHTHMTHEMGEDNAGRRLEEMQESVIQERLTPAEKVRRERKARFLEVLTEEGHITQAAARLGVSPSTVYRWRVQDPTFNDAVADWLTEDMEEVVATNMFRIATSQDPKTANAAVKAGEFMLKSLNRERYGETLKTESTQNINVQISTTTEVREHYRAEQLKKLTALTLDMETT